MSSCMNNSFLTLYYPYGQRQRDLNQHKSPYGRLELVGDFFILISKKVNDKYQFGKYNFPYLYFY